MARWFGSSGIRGPYPDRVSPELALRLGAAAAPIARRILLGHDPRLSSPSLALAFIAGALSGGSQVGFAGPAATPSIAYACRTWDAGIVVTASHNPPSDNGFKFWNPDGSAWGRDQEEALEGRLVPEGNPRAPWASLRAPEAIPDVTREHQEAILSFTGPLRGRVVVDCGNGAGGYITPALLQRAGAEVETLYADPDGRFPHRSSEPLPEHLGELRRRCQQSEAWGIAHDGDADRMVAIDPKGSPVGSDATLVALALLRNARHIVTPIDASAALPDALPGVKLEFCPVGDAAVSRSLRDRGGDLGGETSGTYVVPRFDLAPDGPLAAALFLQAAAEGLVGEARRRLRPIHRLTEKLPLVGMTRADFLARLGRHSEPGSARITRIDGLRIDTDQGWLLIRPSGTEPIVRITVEALTAPDAARLLEQGQSLVRSLLRA